MKKIWLLVTVMLFISPYVLGEDITKTKTVKGFFKKHANFQVTVESAEVYKNSLNKISLQVIKRAVQLAKEDKRKTILKRDIDQATEEIFGKLPLTIAELMEKIKQLPIIDLVKLSNQVKAYSDDLLKSKKK